MMRTMLISLFALTGLVALAGCGDDDDSNVQDGSSSAESALVRNNYPNGPDPKITICHATGSETNPYVEITISVNALPAHEEHQNYEDIIPAPRYGCPEVIECTPCCEREYAVNGGTNCCEKDPYENGDW
ncbi:MAG: hypothetical protein Q8O67_02775 [Deltaproteobacteria bacterium]|nr:hypothetical protein [Deltaproteobacteria bacterium]